MYETNESWPIITRSLALYTLYDTHWPVLYFIRYSLACFILYKIILVGLFSTLYDTHWPVLYFIQYSLACFILYTILIGLFYTLCNTHWPVLYFIRYSLACFILYMILSGLFYTLYDTHWRAFLLYTISTYQLAISQFINFLKST